MLPSPPVMLITDKTQALLPLDDIILQSLEGGCRWILLRDLHATNDELLAQAIKLKKLCTPFGAKCFISRNIHAAKAIMADGIHLSTTQDINEARQLCPDMLIGQSCHNLENILQAEKYGADYVTLSPIFETASKTGYGPVLGLEILRKARQATNLPILALGGVGEAQISGCLLAGATGVAVMGHVMRSGTPKTTLSNLLQANPSWAQA